MSAVVDSTDADPALVIHLIQGIDLLTTSEDGNPSENPFVLIHWGSHELQTEPQTQTVEPRWDAKFEVPCALGGDAESIRFWVYSGGTAVDTLLGKVDVEIDLEAAKKGMFAVPAKWFDVEPIELDAHGKATEATEAKPPPRRLSATLGTLVDQMTASGGNRRLFDEFEKREKKLGRIQIEVKPVAVDDETAGCAEALGATMATMACASGDKNETCFICADEPSRSADEPPADLP